MPQRPLPPTPIWNDAREPADPSGSQPPTPLIVRHRPHHRPAVHLALFLVTVVTTTWVGSYHYQGFMTDFVAELPDVSVFSGMWYSVTILAILGTHEMGHYIACRLYGIDATLPYFVPAPLPILTGTLGAVIRIRQRILSKHILFDIGAAGPIAGFIVVVPALFIGLWLSRVVPLPDDFSGLTLGEPLLFQLAAWSVWGTVPEGHSLNLHPVALAAWFGLLITAFNLFPIAQLDGGHISYAALGHRSTIVTKITTAALVGLAAVVSTSWTVWAMLMIVMVLTFGARHPPTADERVPLDTTRRWIAVGTAIIFIVCFTPAPIEFTDLIVTGE